MEFVDLKPLYRAPRKELHQWLEREKVTFDHYARNAVLAGTVAISMLAGCGGGVDGKPSPPPTAPAPLPVEPPAPVHRAQVWVTSMPGHTGYSKDDTIRLVADFEELVSVVGSPRLAVKIGDAVRHAAFSPWVEDDFPPERLSFQQRFDYLVRAEDRDENGISVGADAFDFTEGAFLNAAGVEVEVEIYSVTPTRSDQVAEPGRDLDSHSVVGTPTLRLCADERERAETHSRVVFEWDGTPFRVDMIRNFPDFVTEADIASLLAPVGLLADKIERQLGYQILEMGEVIPIPRGTPPGWDEDMLAFWRNCPLPRDRGHILGFYMDDVLESVPNAGAFAYPGCGAFTYLRPGVARRWPCSGCSLDGATVHEIFHVLGFVHADAYPLLERGDGVAMSEQLTDSDPWRGADAVTWADIDLLRCIFPQGG